MKSVEALQMELFNLKVEEINLKAELKETRKLIVVARRHLKIQLNKARVTEKTCIRCRRTKERRRFYRDERYADGLYPYCKGCKAKMSRARIKRAA